MQESQKTDIFDKRLMFNRLQIISKKIISYTIFHPRFIGQAKYFEPDDSRSKKFTYTSEIS